MIIQPKDILDFEFKDSKEKYNLYKPTKEQLENANLSCLDIPDGVNLSTFFGRKYKVNILKHYRILKFLEWKTADGRNDVFIPQMTLYLLRAYDENLTKGKLKNLSKKEKENIYRKLTYNVSRGIDAFTKMKVLKEIEGGYIPHIQAKHYFVNKHNLDFVLNIYYDEVAKINTEKKKRKTKYNLNGEIKLDAQLSIEDYKYERVSNLYNALFRLYPQMQYYINEVKKINEMINYEEEKIHFYPSLNINGKGTLKKVGIRAYSEVCQYTSFDKQQELDENYVKDSSKIYREDYLKKRLGDPYDYFDVKASVPRVARAMRCHKPMGSMKEDIYKTLFGDFYEDYNILFDKNVSSFEEKECRNFFKKLFMRLYFGGEPTKIASAILKAEKRAIGKAIRKEEKLAKSQNREPHFVCIPQPFGDLKKKGFDLVSYIEKWQKPVLEILNADTDKDTSVFLDESCIYLIVFKKLKELGIDVIQVYDGFYFPLGTLQSDTNQNGINMEQMVNEAKDEYYNFTLAIKGWSALDDIAKNKNTNAVDIIKLLADSFLTKDYKNFSFNK